MGGLRSSPPALSGAFSQPETAVNAAFHRTGQSDRPVDRVIFYTGIVCAEEFLEVLLLSANAYGFAGLRLLRGMYERVVTMRYLSSHPEAADAYLDYHFVQNGKVAKAVLETLGADLTATQRTVLEEAVQGYDRVKDDFMVSACDKCGTKRVNNTWNKLDLVAVARSDKSTASLLVPCYYEPLGQVHATAQALLSRMNASTEDGFTFDSAPQRKEADRALLLAHNLLLNVLDLQRSHFGLKTLDGPFEECAEAFKEIWASPPS